MATFQQKVAHYIEITTAALNDANSTIQKQAAATIAYNKQASVAAKALVDNGTVEAEHLAKLESKLQDPVYAVTQLVKVAVDKSNSTSQVGQLGTPYGTPKQASRTSGPNQRDIDFVQSLGLGTQYA